MRGCFVLLLLSCQLALGQDQRPLLSPRFNRSLAPTEVYVQIKDSIAFKSWVKEQKAEFTLRKISQTTYKVQVPRSYKINWASAKGVAFVDYAMRQPHTEAVLGEFDIFTNGISAAHDLYPLITGKSRVVSIKEKPFDAEDIDLKGRVIMNNQFDEAATLHATLMATLAVGGANSNSFAKGVAFEAGVTTADFDNLLPDNASSLLQSGVAVQNHSYGVGIENYYGIESKEYDRSIQNFPQMLHVFSSGNEGNKKALDGNYAGVDGFANLTGQFKNSKNVLVVGSADQFGQVVERSSRGPAADGRVKPELIAFGDAGSSESAALVSGVSLLVQQAYQAQTGTLPDAALTKVILINSANDIGRPHVDFESGFGDVNAVGALLTVEQKKYIEADQVANSEKIFDISVPPGQQELKVTLAWTDPPAEPLAPKTLIHDLDLIVRSVTTAEEWFPWVLDHRPNIPSLSSIAQRKIDTLNNVEQVTIDLPEGDYQIIVRSKAIKTAQQKFFIAYQWTGGFEWLHPTTNSFLKAGKENILRWNWSGDNATGELWYQYNDEGWVQISQDVKLNSQSFAWEPERSGRIQFKMIMEGVEYLSPAVAASAALLPVVNFNCPDDVMVSWKKDNGATDYLLLALGEKYMQPITSVADTFAIVSKSSFVKGKIGVAPRYGGKMGLRQTIVDFTQGVGCYLISFLPKFYITYDAAEFTVKLGTTYRLKSVILEKAESGGYQEVQRIDKPTQTDFNFVVQSLDAGVNQFIVRLIVEGKPEIISSAVEVFYVRPNDVYVYPNPVVAGSDLSVLVGSDKDAEIYLIDRNGKKFLKAEDFGSIKNFKTTNLSPGLYFVRVEDTQGKIWFTKVVVQ